MKKTVNKIQFSASDLVNYLGCNYLTELDLKVVNGIIDPPDWINPSLAIIQQKGIEHENAYVDKFQGQEAPVVIYSMASSSAEDAPRGLSFLYNPNRMNVATSRAKCICILVATHKLFEVECNTIDQMKWVNGFCYYREMSKTLSEY